MNSWICVSAEAGRQNDLYVSPSVPVVFCVDGDALDDASRFEAKKPGAVVGIFHSRGVQVAVAVAEFEGRLLVVGDDRGSKLHEYHFLAVGDIEEVPGIDVE